MQVRVKYACWCEGSEDCEHDVHIQVHMNMQPTLCVLRSSRLRVQARLSVSMHVRTYVIIQFPSFTSAVHLTQPFCVLQLLVPSGANIAIDLG